MSTGRWSPFVRQAVNDADRRRAARCRCNPEDGPCQACEREIDRREAAAEARAADEPETLPGEPWDIGALAELEHGPGSRDW